MMEQEVTMTKYGTEEELKYALEHGINITKHGVSSLLSYNDVEDICRDLKIKAELNAVVSPRGEYSSYEHAYYVLKFRKTGSNLDFATYFGKDLVSSYDNYTIEPIEEEENVYE